MFDPVVHLVRGLRPPSIGVTRTNGSPAYCARVASSSCAEVTAPRGRA